MRIILICLLFVLTIVGFSQQKQVCFSIDDLPVVSYGITDSVWQKDIFNRIRSTFKEENVPAIGFVNEGKLYSNEVLVSYQVDLLRNWVADGLELGNHTFSHRDYNNVSFRVYTTSIINGETVTRKLLSEQNKPIRYFRHPFLHVGNTKSKADSLNDFLKKHHYHVAPVTIDTEDYLFALAYSRAKQKNDTSLMTRIGADYIAYMEKKIKHYEKQANHLFGRCISQILLIHANVLNADYLNNLIALYKAHNYTFVTIDKALNDPAYQTEITVFGAWGISWIDRWALSIGKKEFLKEDPATPEYIKKLAE